MRHFILKRVFETVVTLFGLTMFFFVVTYLLPGDPIRALFGFGPVDADLYQELRDQHGLDDPLPLRYIHYLSRLAQLDLGFSLRGGSVNQRILSGLPISLELLGIAVVAQVVIGLTVAWIGSVRRRSAAAVAVNIGTMLFGAIPVFVLAYTLQALFGYKLRWLPIRGIGAGWEGHILPAVVLAITMSAIVARVAGAELAQNRHAPFVRVARAKGLSELRIVGSHVMRPSLPPVVHLMAASAGQLVGSLIVVETVFDIPGLGGTVYDAIRARDQPVIMGVLIIVSVVVLFATLAADVVAAWLDPRLRKE